MKNRFMTILFAGLLLLIAGLFVYAWMLSRKQYLANIRFIKADLEKILGNEAGNLRAMTRSVEREALAPFERGDMRVPSSLTNMLFVMDGGKVVPAGILTADGSEPAGADEVVKQHVRDAWRVAHDIATTVTNKIPPFRIPYQGHILSVNARGQACILPLESFRNRDSSNEIVRMSLDPPGAQAAMSRQLRYPPICVWIPAEELDARTEPVEQAYLLTNVMLAVMLGVFAGMGFGIVMLVKRQHEMAKLKGAFVSSVSHELRTPMALVRLYAESLGAENPPPGTKEKYTKAIMAETDRLIALVNNVLDFSRIEKGLLALNVARVDVSKICNDALDSFNVRLEKEGMTLARKIEPGIMGIADPQALTQVIFNIVDNAIKFSPAKSAIEVEVARSGTDVWLRVKDHGIGIADSLKPRIFMPFVRGDDSRVTAQRGSGIGLSVVAHLLELMHCSVSVADNAGGGTIFEVRLPAADQRDPGA